MPENKTISSSPSVDDQTKKDNATSQTLVAFGAPKEAVEIFQEDKMTNTEGVNKGTFFSYPCRRHSCSLVNIPAPCVNKMISRIEDVESKIEGYLKQFEASLEEWRQAAGKDQRVSKVEPKEERDETCPELKQEMEKLLSEAIFLVKSLETDRAEAQETLKRQYYRKKEINDTIDSWSIWRLQEMPMAVQKEHEAYQRDIMELRWHVDDNAYKIKHLEEQKAAWEEANEKIQADINYMKEHSTVLKSKLMHEMDDLKEYGKKKFEVMEQYRHVHGELQVTKDNCEKTKLKVTQNREELERGIEADIRYIQACMQQTEKLETLFEHYATQIQTVSENIEKSEEVELITQKETKSSTDELNSLRKMLEDLKRIYEQVAWRKNSYEADYHDMLKKFYSTKKECENELSDVIKDFSDLSATYNKLLEENKKLENDIEITADAVHDSLRKKAEMESEIQALMLLKLKNEEYLKSLYKDAYHIGAVFHLTRYKTEDLEEHITEVRRKFQGREEFLKKITRSEVAKGMSLQKKLFTLQEEEELEREEITRRKAIYSLILAEIEEPLLQMEENAELIEAIHKEHSNKLVEIIAKRNDVKTVVERTKKKLKMRGMKTQEALLETETQHSMIFSEIEAVKAKTAAYEAKLITLNKELEDRERTKMIFDKIVENLRERHAFVKFKKDHMQAVYDHLISEKLDCEDRLDEEDQRHKNLIVMRQNTLEELKKLQIDCLAENLRLAQEYRKLQMNFLEEKDNYYNHYDRQLSLNASIRDKKELCQLQRKVHKMWQKYLDLVALHSQTRLAQFQSESQESIQKILAVQDESSNLMQHIVEFFQDFSSGSCENQD